MENSSFILRTVRTQQLLLAILLCHWTVRHNNHWLFVALLRRVLLVRQGVIGVAERRHRILMQQFNRGTLMLTVA